MHPRKLTEVVVVTFATYSEAMSFEQECSDRSIPGRLIPVPRSLSAGCGVAWRSDSSYRGEVSHAAISQGLPLEDVHDCLL